MFVFGRHGWRGSVTNTWERMQSGKFFKSFQMFCRIIQKLSEEKLKKFASLFFFTVALFSGSSKKIVHAFFFRM